MEKSAVFHQSESIYSYPLNATAARIILRTKRGDSLHKLQVIWNTSHLFWRERSAEDMELFRSDALFDYYKLDMDNGNPPYSYLFSMEDEKGVTWYYNESGFDTRLHLTTTFEDNFVVNFPNERDIIYPNRAFEGRVFYQIFPERFCRGDHTKDDSYIDLPWDSAEPVNHRFAGGDLKGIENKLPYLKELGVGAIYLNPIHPSISAHKYDVDDYLAIDPMFGTMEDFKQLVQEAHKLDIKILMDLVFNHSGYYNPLFQDVVQKGKDSPYYDWYFVYGDKPGYEEGNYNTFCGVRMMPKLNTNNPEVQEYLTQVGEFYMRECAVDGFRLDVAFDVSHDFWRFFKNRLKKINPDVFILGEDWLNSDSFLGNDQWESVMHYPLMYACSRYLAEDRYDAQGFCDYLNGILMRYREGHNRNMVTLLDSHDTARFLTRLKGDKNRQLLALAILLFYQGCPMLYYGDEIFMEGENDPYCRKPMEWNSPLYSSLEHQLLRKLLAYRQEDTVQYGDIRLYESRGMACIERSYRGKKLTLCLNHSGGDVAIGEQTELSHRLEGSLLHNEGFALFRGYTGEE